MASTEEINQMVLSKIWAWKNIEKFVGEWKVSNKGSKTEDLHIPERNSGAHGRDRQSTT